MAQLWSENWLICRIQKDFTHITWFIVSIKSYTVAILFYTNIWINGRYIKAFKKFAEILKRKRTDNTLSKIKNQKTKSCLQNTTQITKHWATRTQLKSWVCTKVLQKIYQVLLHYWHHHVTVKRNKCRLVWKLCWTPINTKYHQ